MIKAMQGSTYKMKKKKKLKDTFNQKEIASSRLAMDLTASGHQNEIDLLIKLHLQH